MSSYRSCGLAAGLGVSAPLLQGLLRQDAPPPRQFHVRDYGARPDPRVDSGPGVRAAIAAAMASGGPAEVILGEGVYRVSRGPDEAYALAVVAARDLTVRGQGSSTEIVITDPELGGFRLSACENVTVAGLVLDYDPPPYSQSTVTAVDLGNQTFDVAPDEGFLALDSQAFADAKATWGLVIRPGRDGAPTRYGPTAIPAVVESRMDGNRWGMKVGGPPTGYPDPLRTSGMAPGDSFVHPARTYTAAVGADYSDGVLLEGITLYASPGLAFCPYLCGSVTIRDCHIQPRPGSTRLLSTNADGVHCRGAREGITIDGCSFEGMSDDAINIHSSPIPVLEVLSPTELIVQRYHYTLQAGDRVEAMDSREARVRGQATVASVEEVPDRWAYHVRLDQPVQGLRGGTGFEDADNLYNLSECATGSVVSGCHFGSFRGRGVLLSCVGATVSGNTVDVTEGWGVVLYHESTRWGEGPLARDIRIVGNTFNGRGGYQAAIFAYPTRRDGRLAEAREMRDLVIQGNRFSDLGVPAAELHSCRDVRVLDNVVEATAAAHRPRSTYASVALDNCAGVKIAGLTVRDEDPRHVAAVLISPTTAPGVEGAEVTDLSAILAPIAVPVRDERASAP
jgi:hypothetical protein